MNLGVEDKKKLATLSVAGIGALGAVFYMYTQLFPSESPAPAANPSQTAQKSPSTPPKTTSNPHEKPVAFTAAQLDPTLHMGPMLTTEALLYQGNGRNIFSGEAAAAIAIPRAVASARPRAVAATYTPPTGPPPLPPIDLKFFGTAAHSGQQARAFLLHGEDVYLASVGDVVQRRYKILSISANSITIMDLANNNQQSLPLLAN